MSVPACLFTERSTGLRFRVHIAPMERRGGLGVDRRLNALSSETDEREWIGSVPVYHNVGLADLSENDLEELLDQAIGRG